MRRLFYVLTTKAPMGWRKNTRLCIYPARCERTFGGNPPFFREGACRNYCSILCLLRARGVGGLPLRRSLSTSGQVLQYRPRLYYGKRRAPPDTGFLLYPLRPNSIWTFFTEKSSFSCIYQNFFVPLHPQRFYRPPAR